MLVWSSVDSNPMCPCFTTRLAPRKSDKRWERERGRETGGFERERRSRIETAWFSACSIIMRENRSEEGGEKERDVKWGRGREEGRKAKGRAERASQRREDI